ncbi:MAG: NAD(P)/FAD-dependent oxidoreductase [Chloroflexota bacterium]
MTANQYDAIVIGGGHNGLVAAAYMAKYGGRVVVLEARHKIGGAADTMSPWPEAPDLRVTTLSYVMGMMPPEIIADLRLAEHGFRIFPQPLTYHPVLDGRSMIHDGGPRELETVARFSRSDAETLPAYYEWMGRIADVMRPMLMEAPPRLGSSVPGDLIDQLRFVLRRRKQMNVRMVADITKLFTMSVADLLREWFESSELIGAFAMAGVGAAWGGPETPGTAYGLLHLALEALGEGEQTAVWGYPEGGMGAVADALRRSAESFGAEVRVNAPVERVLIRDGRTYGVVLAGGEEVHAPVVVTTCHPKITFERQIDARDLPADFVKDIRNWKSRSGMVKVNAAIDRLPEFTADPGKDPEILGGGIYILEGVEDLEKGFADAVGGRASAGPWADMAIPTVFDRTLAPEGTHIVSLASQWVPASWADEDHRPELEAYADRVIDRVEAVAPGFRDSILHRQVVGPREMQEEWNLVGGSVFHGEITFNQLFHMRPAPGYADYRTPIKGLYQGSSATHAGGGVNGLPGHHVVKAIRQDKALGRGRAR